jgi:hypothetical protein
MRVREDQGGGEHFKALKREGAEGKKKCFGATWCNQVQFGATARCPISWSDLVGFGRI